MNGSLIPQSINTILYNFSLLLLLSFFFFLTHKIKQLQLAFFSWSRCGRDSFRFTILLAIRYRRYDWFDNHRIWTGLDRITANCGNIWKYEQKWDNGICVKTMVINQVLTQLWTDLSNWRCSHREYPSFVSPIVCYLFVCSVQPSDLHGWSKHKPR